MMKDKARCGIVELQHTNKPKGALPFMNSITQDMRYRQSLMEYTRKYGVARASRKYNKSRSYIYFWLARYDGSIESLKPKSKRPNTIPTNTQKRRSSSFPT